MELKHVVSCVPDEKHIGPIFCDSELVASNISSFLSEMHEAERFYVETAYYYHDCKTVGGEIAKCLLKEFPANDGKTPNDCWREEWRLNFGDFLDQWHIDSKVWKPSTESGALHLHYIEWALQTELCCAETLALHTMELAETECRLDETDRSLVN